MGLVMLGSKSAQAIEDMVAYSQETQHEKILRGLAVGECRGLDVTADDWLGQGFSRLLLEVLSLISCPCFTYW